MTEENPLTIAELGAYTNNSMNREGIKHLVDTVNGLGEPPSYTAGNSIVITENDEIKLDSSWEKVDSAILNNSNNRKTFLKKYSKTHDILIFANDGAFLLELPNNIAWEEHSDNLRSYPIRTIYVRNTEEYLYSIDNNYIYSENIGLKQVGLGSSSVEIECSDADGTPITSSNIENYITKTEGATPTYTFIKPFFVHIKYSSTSGIEVSGMCYGDNYSIQFRKSTGAIDGSYAKVSLPLRAVYEWILNPNTYNSLNGFEVAPRQSYYHTFYNSTTGNNWYIRKKLPNTYIEPTP